MRQWTLDDDDPVTPVNVIDDALSRLARPGRVPARVVIDVLHDVRTSLVLNATLAALRRELVRRPPPAERWWPEGDSR